MTTKKKTTTTTDRRPDTIPLKHFQQPFNYFEHRRKSVPFAPRRGRRDTPSRLLLVFPVELPNTFFEELDCLKTLTQFFAVHIDLPTDCLLRENGMAIKPCPNEWVFSALIAYEPVAEWCQRNRIDLSTGRHWLVCDSVRGKSYIADPRTAMRCLVKQALVRKAKPMGIND